MQYMRALEEQILALKSSSGACDSSRRRDSGDNVHIWEWGIIFPSSRLTLDNLRRERRICVI